MPVSARSVNYSESDNCSLLSQATTTMSIGDSLSAYSAKKGILFNIMSVGQANLGKTALMSALFNKNLWTVKDKKNSVSMDTLNPQVAIESKTFEIDDQKVRVKLTVVESQNYGEALCVKNTHQPLVEFIEQRFADWHKRESRHVDRRSIQDKMVHCVFFFISAMGHGLSKLDLEFLKSINNRVNIVPIIARAEALSLPDRLAFKRRVKDDLERENIEVYQMPDPDPEDPEEVKRVVKEIQDTMPFAVCYISYNNGTMDVERELDYATINHFNKDHSDFLLLKSMLLKQMPDLRDTTHEIFYENFWQRSIANQN